MRKSPLNAIENPIYPDIKRGPPRRRFVKPKWTVDADREATEGIIDHPELYAHAILEHDYSESKFKYGRMNPDHTLIVNEGFRPPPEDLEDYLPLSRMKVGVNGARTNPGGGYFKAQNTSLPDVNGYLSDRVKSATSVPTIEIKIAMPLQVPIHLDREPVDTLPAYSTSAGGKYRAASSNLAVRHQELEDKTPRVGAVAGYRTKITPSEDYDRPIDLEDVVPTHSVSAGYRQPGVAWQHEAYAPVELEDGVRTSAEAGHATVALYRGEGYERVRLTDREHRSADSGKAYRRRDDIHESTNVRIVDRPTSSVRAHTTHLKEGFRPLDLEERTSKVSTGALEAGVRVVTSTPRVVPHTTDVSHLAEKQVYQVSSGRTAPPSRFDPEANRQTHKRKSQALSARGNRAHASHPHQGFHTILGSTRV